MVENKRTKISIDKSHIEELTRGYTEAVASMLIIGKYYKGTGKAED